MANNKDFKVKNGIQPTAYHEAVGTVTSGSEGYYLAGASYDSKYFDVNSQLGDIYGGAFKSDGTKFYAVNTSTPFMVAYDLSTAWDISTAVYNVENFNPTSQDTIPYGVDFKPDGTKMYVVFNGNDTVYQYSLSTAWNISSASYDTGKTVSVTSQTTFPVGVKFKPDGTKMYVNTIGIIYQYTLSTAWDLSTASYESKSFDHTSESNGNYQLDFNSDGTKFWVANGSSDAIYQYSLSTAYDISTASYDNVSFSTIGQGTNVRGLIFKSDGEKMYTIDGASDQVLQYSTVLTTNTLDLSTGSVFEITPTSDIEIDISNPADSGTVSQATLLLDGVAATTYDIANTSSDGKTFSVGTQTSTTPIGMHMSTDGTKLFVVSNSNDTVFEYDLSTAYDISTASYNSVSLNVSAVANGPTGLTFSSDGTKMYVVNSSVDLYQYTLTTAWDLSTASYDSKSFSYTGQVGNPRGAKFNNDGTVLFLGSIAASDGIFQYSLTTAWDISTASYASKFLDVSSQAGEMSEFDFNANGTKVFVMDYDDNDVHQYSLSTAFDISTATYDNISVSTTDTTNSARGLTFADSGKKMYVMTQTDTLIYQYSTATPATITYPSALEWPSGTAPTSPAIGETDVITFSTTDGGTTYQAVQAIDGAS